MRLLYAALFYLSLPFVFGRLAWRGRRLPAYRKRWGERLALYDFPPQSGTVWFHAVSVGEAEAAFPVIRAFRARCPSHPILVTCTTPTGSARIRAVLGEAVTHVYLPYDLPDCVGRFLDHFLPVLGVVMETEIWPNHFLACRRRGIPLAIVNGRLSVKSAKAYGRIRRVVSESLSGVSLVAAQTAADAERYRGIGADPEKLIVAGNVKFDLEFTTAMRDQAAEIRAKLLEARPVWIAGSTHGGEEEQVLAAHRQILREVPNTLLILAPRHPDRMAEVADLCAKSGFSLRRRSEGRTCDSQTEVFLLDTLGELRLFYAASDVAFVGGSLVPRGGHNMLEPAAAGVPALFGPHVFNFEEIARRLGESGGGVTVRDSGELARWTVRLLLDSGQRHGIGGKGRVFVDANRGAVTRVTELIAALLPKA